MQLPKFISHLELKNQGVHLLTGHLAHIHLLEVPQRPEVPPTVLRAHAHYNSLFTAREHEASNLNQSLRWAKSRESYCRIASESYRSDSNH